MTSAQQVRESRKKSLIECINNGILKKKDIIRKTGINIHVIHNIWIDDDVQEALKKTIYNNPHYIIKDDSRVIEKSDLCEF